MDKLQRTIKFRIWTGSKFKTIPEKFYGKRCAHSPCMYSGHNGYSVFGFTQREDYVIQQFTGFTDTSGVEIYEGDLVNFYVPAITHGPEREDYQSAEVWFDEEYGEWSFGKYKTEQFDWSFCWRDIKGVEVVGNIFEGLNKTKSPDCGDFNVGDKSGYF